MYPPEARFERTLEWFKGILEQFREDGPSQPEASA